jgi:RimJ/RimL family protein N-acetyltransferase
MFPDLTSSDHLFPDLTRDDVFRLEAKRLWLRWPRVQDAAAIARLAGDKEVADMVGILPHPFPSGEAEKLVFEARKANAIGSQIKLAIADKRRPDVFMGIIGSRILPTTAKGHSRASFGYWLGSPYWGQGFATEAAHALIDAIFSYTDVTELESSIRVINPASRRVAEKCGFQFVGSDMWDAPALKSRVAVDKFLLSRSTWASLKGWREPNISASKPEPQLEAYA